MLKYILVAALITLLFGGGAARLKALMASGKRLKKDFDDGKGRAEDPVGHAREVAGRVQTKDDL
jgi:hypothetical protein